MQACILIKTFPTKIVQVLDAVRHIKAIVKSYPVYGRYDVVAFIDDASLEIIHEVTREVNAIKGIKTTETILPG